MKIIGSKAAVKEILDPLLEDYSQKGEAAFVGGFAKKILEQKIRFPVLEFIASQICLIVPANRQLQLTDKIIALNEIGGNVLAGIILQIRLEKDYNNSLKKAVEYIIRGDQWYVCDIIGERVMGHALLKFPARSIPVLKKYALHKDNWIVRSVGVATHYAVKKGLPKKEAETLFGILISCAGTTDFHTKKGIGWAAKTIAKFHPDIVLKYKKELESDEVKQWFKTKIKIGLGRSDKYAKRHNG